MNPTKLKLTKISGYSGYRGHAAAIESGGTECIIFAATVDALNAIACARFGIILDLKRIHRVVVISSAELPFEENP